MLAAEAYRLRPGPATIDGVIKAAQRAPDLRRYVRAHSAPVIGVGFDQSGAMVVSYDKSGGIVATEWATGKTVATARAETNGASVVTTSYGVVVVGLSNVELRDPMTLGVKRSWTSADQRPFAGAVASGNRLLLLRLDGSIAVTALDGPAGPSPLRWTALYGSAIYGGLAMPDGSFVTAGVSGDLNELIRFSVDSEGRTVIRWRKKLNVPVSSIALGADATKVILGFSRGVLVYDAETSDGLNALSLESGVNAVATSPALGQYALTANQDGRIAYVDLSTFQPYKEQIHDGRATAVAWSSTGQVITGDGDGTIAFLDTGPNRLTGVRSIGAAAAGIAIRPDGRTVVAALADGGVVELTVDFSTVGSKITTKRLGKVAASTALALVGDVVVVGDEDGSLHAIAPDGNTWSVETGTGSSVAAVSRVGDDTVVTRTSSLVLQTWRVADGKFTLLRTLSDRSSAHSATTDAAGTPVVAYFEGSSGVVVANASNGTELARYPLDNSFAEIAIAPNGLTVAVSNGSDVQLLSKTHASRSLKVGGDIVGLSFTDNGARLVAFDSASGARVIDVATGQPMGFIHDEDGPLLHATAVGPDNLVAVATANQRQQPGQVFVVSFDPAIVIADGCAAFGRELTPAEIKRFDLDRSSNPCRVAERST